MSRLKAPVKGNAPMPAHNSDDQQRIIDAIGTLRSGRSEAERLLATVGPRELSAVLHSMRRWYTSQNGHQAAKLLAHGPALSRAMDLRAPIGAFRGFKVDAANSLASVSEGQTMSLPVTRNGSCSSWTTTRDVADRFSGASKGKVGLVVQLVDGRGVQAFIAPPERSEPWFNALYEKTMGRSHRFKEGEYAVFAPTIRVRIVRVKR